MSRRRRADRKLHLELLRARAAADRLELSLAVQDISEQLDPLRRAVDSVGKVTRALGGRGRALGWLAAGVAALLRGRHFRRTATEVATALQARGRSGSRWVALASAVAGVVALLVRRARRSRSPDPDPDTG